MAQMLSYAIAELEKDYKSMPGGEELIKKISKRFEKYYNSPNVENINSSLNTNFTVDEVRTLLFAPSKQYASYYPRLITPLDGQSLSSNDSGLFSLTMLYIVHRKQWPFVVEFIVHNGLSVLAQLMCDSNPYVRGQVIEVFLAATDCDTFDWFVPVNDETKHLHIRMLLLFFDTHFLSNLLANRTSYPGGSMRCLQILAFYLSYLRVQHTSSQKLGLSPELLSALQEWCSDRDDVEEQEAKLAETLVQDFGSAVIDEDEDIGIVGCDDYILYGLTHRPTNIAIPALPSPKVMPPATELTAENLKEQGNECYRSGKHAAALVLYRKALLKCDKSDPLAVSLYYNCGSCYWKLWQAEEAAYNTSPVKDAPQEEAQQVLDEVTSVCNKVHALEACVEHCTAACKLSPTHHRAQYRLCSALIELHRESDALQQIAAAKQVLTSQYATLSDDSARNEVAVALKLLEDLRVRCNARMLLHHKTSVESSTASILGQLRARREREMNAVSHPWSGWEPPQEEDQSEEPQEAERADEYSSSSKQPQLSDDSLKAKKKSVAEISKKDAPPAKKKMSGIKYLKGLRVAKSDVAVLQVLQQAWDNKVHLKHIFGASIDEELLMKVLQLIVSDDADADTKKKILLELNKCSHIETALRIALVGDDPLRSALQHCITNVCSESVCGVVVAALQK